MWHKENCSPKKGSFNCLHGCGQAQRGASTLSRLSLLSFFGGGGEMEVHSISISCFSPLPGERERGGGKGGKAKSLCKVKVDGG